MAQVVLGLVVVVVIVIENPRTLESGHSISPLSCSSANELSVSPEAYPKEGFPRPRSVVVDDFAMVFVVVVVAAVVAVVAVVVVVVVVVAVVAVVVVVVVVIVVVVIAGDKGAEETIEPIEPIALGHVAIGHVWER
jgi:hypothetical protein